MKKFAVALLATAALSMPAMAAPNMNQQSQQPQVLQPQGQKSQAQYTNTNTNQSRPTNANQSAQTPPNKERTNKERTISPNSLSRNEIRQVQQALDQKGFQVGRVDGRWGPKTSNAVKQFQQSKKIQANGQLDRRTLSDLGLKGAQFAQQSEGNSPNSAKR
jgi:Putative peptidoglycan binding domain